jgi:hypothetical protein
MKLLTLHKMFKFIILKIKVLFELPQGSFSDKSLYF